MSYLGRGEVDASASCILLDWDTSVDETPPDLSKVSAFDWNMLASLVGTLSLGWSLEIGWEVSEAVSIKSGTSGVTEMKFSANDIW